jgi:small subunit ribosomal protein S12
MSRLHSLVKVSQVWRNLKNKNKKIIKGPALEGCPQKRGICMKLFFRTPRKPNSAIRKVVKLQVARTLKRVVVYIPGIRHSLQQWNIALMRGGRVKDLPGVKYHLIPGAFDFHGITTRKNSRSKYGCKKY